MSMTAVPMFPLGTVLFPGVPLPLQVFEPRYRVLFQRCFDGNEPFGVVLIERGSEVGGGDLRTDVGTTARIVQAADLPDGRITLVAVGEDRIRVTRWLEDDPHPLAEVEPWADDEPFDPDALVEHLVETAAMLVESLTRHEELGDRVAPPQAVAEALAEGLGGPTRATENVEDPDPTRATYLLCALSPFGPLDRQQLLRADDPVSRLELLTDLLRDDLDDLTARRNLDP